MGADLRLSLGAQDPWWALRAAQGSRACRPCPDIGDQSFRGKARTPATPPDHKTPEQRDEGTVQGLAHLGPGPHHPHRGPAPGARRPQPWGTGPAGWPAFHDIRPGSPGPPSALLDHHGLRLPLLPQERAVGIPTPGRADLLELQGDASGLGTRPAAA
ncbi:hypothetical protein GW7_13617, partial [Heterocephalus glaber]